MRRHSGTQNAVACCSLVRVSMPLASTRIGIKQYHVSHPIAAMYTGLTDIDQQGNIVPGIAESWESNKELTSWVFRLRKGVLFHNGREVDAEAVKLNILRIKDPAIGYSQARGALESVATVDILDKYTVRFNLIEPDVTLPSNLMHYPINLQAPDNFDKAAEHPIGTGPFKFVSWTRFNETRLVRFENYWETDAEGNNLPYLDEIIGKPKREDSVRLTALRTGQINLMENMAYADVERFKKSIVDQYQLLASPPRRGLCGLQFSPGTVPGQGPTHGRGTRHRPHGHPSFGVLQAGGHARSGLSARQPLAPGGDS